MTTDITQLINAALDRVREEQRLSTDEALARALNVDAVTIWRWRTGRIGKSTRILLPLIVCDGQAAEQAA